MIAPDMFPAVRSWLAGLTPAERLVAVHLAQGLTNKEISTLLGKAEPTIKHQVSSIMEKTGTPSRCRFIALYYQQLVMLTPSRDLAKCSPFGQPGQGWLESGQRCVAFPESSPIGKLRPTDHGFDQIGVFGKSSPIGELLPALGQDGPAALLIYREA